jgi:hypothetical protein
MQKAGASFGPAIGIREIYGKPKTNSVLPAATATY